jgi:hypothetical protein
MTAFPRHLVPCAALALVLTLLNALKPLHIDDAAYYCFASQIAAAPLSPYDFEILWGQQLLPANRLLAPPLLPYWWAAGIRLFGENPFLWKFWLLPICLLLVFTLHALARRCARGLAMPLVCLIVLSPSLLPGLNLMLDVPALTLSLCALTLFLRAVERDALGGALLAGLVAGLALQTKYTALVTPAVLLLYAGLFRRVRLGVIAAMMAVVVFVGWEILIALRHGQSHFLSNLSQQDGALLEKIGPLFRALLNLAGGLAPAIALLGLIALGLSRWVVLSAAAAVLLGYGLVVFLPQEAATGMTVSALICRILGLLVLGTLAAVAWRLASGRSYPNLGGPPRRLEWFLCGWLALEVAGYFVLTPFPAARRVMPPLVVAALLTGRLADRTCRSLQRTGMVWTVTGVGTLLGLLFYAVDVREAVAQKRAIERAARHVRRQDATARVWYTGTWGLKFYAERAGLWPVLPDRSALRRGDWLIAPDAPLPSQEIDLPGAPLALAERVEITDGIPLATVGGYYGGNVPLEHHRGPRVSLRLYRVTADFTPARSAKPQAASGGERPRQANAARDALDLARQRRHVAGQ